MKFVFVLVLLGLSFAGGVYYGQSTSINFAGWVNSMIGAASEQATELSETIVEGAPHETTATVLPEPDTSPTVDRDPVKPEIAPISARFTPEDQMRVCPRMTVSNAPSHDDDLWISEYSPFVDVNGVTLAIAPTNGACLSSGFGPRNNRTHKGIDYRADPSGTIHAAASGMIREAGYRDDYGNYVVIDHGDGVFTRYAHLARLESGIAEGTAVEFGAPLGPMGNTASYPIPVHLHFELLLGDYETQAASFGLTPRSPFDFPYVSG